MTLHIFNPEHDIALASGLTNFTAPHAGRQLRHDLGYLPALWASSDDAVLVDDAETAQRLTRRRNVATRLFVEKQQLAGMAIDRIEPWGWNAALRAYLLRQGVDEQLMPTEQQLEEIRQLSHRSTAARLLPRLQTKGTTGEAHLCSRPEEVEALLEKHGQVVMKAPWSSSGRGLRFLSTERTPFSMQERWFAHVVEAQGCVTVEPYYNKVKDFGMEFTTDAAGNVSYMGLSLFHTANGAYTGNILATEAQKEKLISGYVPADLLNTVKENICREAKSILQGKYCGPFGVDMMIVAADNEWLLHPCVEINLRRTMGHVALEIGKRLNPAADDEVRYVMRIGYAENRPATGAGTGKNYQLKIQHL